MAKKRSILEKTTVDDSRGTQKDEKQRGDETKRSPKEGKEAESFVVAEESGTSSKRLRMAESITAEDAEQLIDDARNCALALSTGNPEWRSESPPACEFEKGAEEGSRKDASGSQEFHQKMHGLVTALLAGGRKELRVGSLGQFVVDALMMLEKNVYSKLQAKVQGWKCGTFSYSSANAPPSSWARRSFSPSSSG